MVTKLELRERIGAEIGHGVVFAILVHDGFDIKHVDLALFKSKDTTDSLGLCGAIDSAIAPMTPKRVPEDARNQMRYVIQEAIEETLNPLMHDMIQAINNGDATLEEFIEALRQMRQGGNDG
jgi:hypothetical protein